MSADDEIAAPRITSFALHGTTDDDAEPHIFLLSVLDEQVLDAGWLKSDREALMVEAFQAAWPPFAKYHVLPGGDPPDFILTSEGCDPVGLEVTQFTLETYRRDIAQARELSHALSVALYEDEGRYQHLVGRSLCVALKMIPPRKEITEIVAAVLETASADIGYFGEDVDLSRGFPMQLSSTRGLYGDVGAHTAVTVQMGPHPKQIDLQVTLSTPAEVPKSAIWGWLHGVIAKKDRVENQVLLISFGAPDADGFVSSVDTYLYDEFAGHRLSDEDRPEHLSAVYLHRWSGHDVTEIYRR